MARSARKPYQHFSTYISKSFTYSTSGIGTAATVQVGTLPAGCLVTDSIVRIETAFDAGTTNVIKVGTSADDDAFVATGDLDETATGTTFIDRNAGVVLTADTPIYVQYTYTGNAPTAGAADVVIRYIPTIED